MYRNRGNDIPLTHKEHKDNARIISEQFNRNNDVDNSNITTEHETKN